MASRQARSSKNGRHRPWFRFWLTIIILIVSSKTVILLFCLHDEISSMVAVLIGAIITKLADALGLSFKWWFDLEDSDESQNTMIRSLNQ